MLDECEHHRHTLNAAVRENILTRMENVVAVLQQVLSVPAIRSLECNAFLEELLRSMRHLYLQWMRAETDSRCTNAAVYSLECPPVIHTTPGRPKLDIPEDVLIQLKSFGFTWKKHF